MSRSYFTSKKKNITKSVFFALFPKIIVIIFMIVKQKHQAKIQIMFVFFIVNSPGDKHPLIKYKDLSAVNQTVTA